MVDGPLADEEVEVAGAAGLSGRRRHEWVGAHTEGSYARRLPRRTADPDAAHPDAALIRERLANQRLAGASAQSPEELVRWFGAVQAQDYPGALWAIGLRVSDSTATDVEAAIEARRIVRTWPMRRTLHFVPAEDVRWMLRLLAARVISASAGRYRQLGLGEADFKRAARILTRALRGEQRLTRPEAYATLARGGVDPSGQRGIHLLAHLAQQGLLCFGPHQGKQPTFVLLDEWVPAASEPTRDEALATLATRYFTSHGPATERDFAWWAGLPLRDARRGVEAAGSALHLKDNGTVSAGAATAAPRTKRRAPVAALPPPWDEYLVAYRDRSFAVDRPSGRLGLELIGKPVVLVDGRVRGTWSRNVTGESVRVSLNLVGPLANREKDALRRAVDRYARFVGKSVEIIGASLQPAQ